MEFLLKSDKINVAAAFDEYHEVKRREAADLIELLRTKQNPKTLSESTECVLSLPSKRKALSMPVGETNDNSTLAERLERCIRLRIRYDSTTIGERQFLRSLLIEINNTKENND